MASTLSLGKGLTFTISALGALWLGACDGSTSVLDNTGGSAGSANVAGSAGVGGSVGHGGAGGSVGGSGSTAGAGGACFGFCPALDCAQGYTLEPGQCCPTCAPNGGAGGSSSTGGSAGVGAAGGVGGCGDIACDNIGCGLGTTPVIEPGSCCPICVPDTEACTAGKDGYQALLDNLLAQPGATSCMVDGDCALLNGSPQCGSSCAASAVNRSQAMDMADQLSLWEKSYCSTCMPIYLPCAAPPQPFCEAGRCQLYHAL